MLTETMLDQIAARIPDLEISQPYKGRWLVSVNQRNVGAINGDHVIGFTARDAAGRSLGRFDDVDVALDTLLAAS